LGNFPRHYPNLCCFLLPGLFHDVTPFSVAPTLFLRMHSHSGSSHCVQLVMLCSTPPGLPSSSLSPHSSGGAAIETFFLQCSVFFTTLFSDRSPRPSPTVLGAVLGTLPLVHIFSLFPVWLYLFPPPLGFGPSADLGPVQKKFFPLFPQSHPRPPPTSLEKAPFPLDPAFSPNQVGFLSHSGCLLPYPITLFYADVPSFHCAMFTCGTDLI